MCQCFIKSCDHLTGCRLFGGKQLVVQRHADVTEDLLFISVSIQLRRESETKISFDGGERNTDVHRRHMLSLFGQRDLQSETHYKIMRNEL